MQDWYCYPAVFHWEGEDVSVSFPDLPGCLTCAHDRDTALARAREALGLYLADGEQMGEALPAPSPASALAPGPGEEVVEVQVYMPDIRSRMVYPLVEREVTLPAWLAAAAQRAGLDLSQVLQQELQARLGLGAKPGA